MIAQIGNILIGLFLMTAPAVFAYGAPASTSDRIAGPFIATCGAIAVTESTRNVRLVILPFSAWLIIAPLVLGSSIDASLVSAGAGVATAALALVKGRIRHPFAGGWAALFKKGACGTFDDDGRPRDHKRPEGAST